MFYVLITRKVSSIMSPYGIYLCNVMLQRFPSRELPVALLVCRALSRQVLLASRGTSRWMCNYYLNATCYRTIWSRSQPMHLFGSLTPWGALRGNWITPYQISHVSAKIICRVRIRPPVESQKYERQESSPPQIQIFKHITLHEDLPKM